MEAVKLLLEHLTDPNWLCRRILGGHVEAFKLLETQEESNTYQH